MTVDAGNKLTWKDNIVFVLVRPSFLGNIGSAARVMKNFGFTKLRIVNPPRNYLDAEARKMAVDAFDVLKQAKIEISLSAALTDINLAFSTSSCQQRSNIPRPLATVVDELEQKNYYASNKIAFVFGNERNGLTSDEIARCHDLIAIPTNVDFVSLNLAQALGIVAYELSRKEGAELLTASAKIAEAQILPDGSGEDEMMELLSQLMERADFSRTWNSKKVKVQMRGALQKMRLNQREFDLFRGLLLRVNDKLRSVK